LNIPSFTNVIGDIGNPDKRRFDGGELNVFSTQSMVKATLIPSESLFYIQMTT
jgi:hypothetical protein